MRKLWLVLVIFTMTAAMLFAGGGGGQQTTTTAASGGSIKVEIFDRGTDGGKSLAYDNAWTKWVQNKVKADLGIDVEFVPVGRWTEETDLVNLIASGSAPDLCYTYNGGNVANFRNQGGLLNLAPYVDQHLPDLKKLLGADPALTGKDFIYRQQDVNTGELYSIQAARVALAQRNIFIRKDWLDALRLPMPTSLETFYQTLVAFRARATELPGGLTQARVVPFMTGDDIRWSLADFMNHFMNSQTDRERWIRDIYESNFMVPGYKNGVQEMNKWYNENLIYRDFPLITTETDANNVLKSGVAGAYSGNWDSPYRLDTAINTDLARNVPGAEFVPVDLNLKNKSMMDKSGLYIFVPASSRNPVGALKYLNWLAKPENYTFLQIGTEGVNHIMENGAPRTFTMPANHPWIQNSGNNIDMTMPMNGVQMGNDTLNARVLALSYGGVPTSVIENAYAISVKDARAAAIYIATTTVTQYSQTLVDKRKTVLAQSVTAPVAQFSATYDRLYEDWRTSGAQEVYDERARLYPAR